MLRLLPRSELNEASAHAPSMLQPSPRIHDLDGLDLPEATKLTGHKLLSPFRCQGAHIEVGRLQVLPDAGWRDDRGLRLGLQRVGAVHLRQEVLHARQLAPQGIQAAEVALAAAHQGVQLLLQRPAPLALLLLLLHLLEQAGGVGAGLAHGLRSAHGPRNDDLVAGRPGSGWPRMARRHHGRQPRSAARAPSRGQLEARGGDAALSMLSTGAYSRRLRSG
mmetsp:Transcript_163017/g.396087  ORF Transcript_163017/g.396087 Transcript_163017/m.396087 type:complete len:220 (-) Transcript_163017:9-668(-)